MLVSWRVHIFILKVLETTRDFLGPGRFFTLRPRRVPSLVAWFYLPNDPGWSEPELPRKKKEVMGHGFMRMLVISYVSTPNETYPTAISFHT